MPGLEHLDIANLSGGKERSGRDWKVESEEEFDFGSTEEDGGESAKEAEGGWRGINRREETEPTEPKGGRAVEGRNGGRANQEKAKTKRWLDVVKGLNIEEELEKANSDKSGNK